MRDCPRLVSGESPIKIELNVIEYVASKGQHQSQHAYSRISIWTLSPTHPTFIQFFASTQQQRLQKEYPSNLNATVNGLVEPSTPRRLVPLLRSDVQRQQHGARK